ncbi:MAG: AraC family transcriptional regulator [Treponema sp.]|jgi:AraC-like DNA-binding protein|nr:AraC family transcriptional regulator [Treponema sp.]
MAENNRINLDTTNRFLMEALIDLVPKPGYFETGIHGLAIVRHDEPTGIIQRFYSPMIILLVQGKKLSIIGTEEVVWGKNKYMLIGTDLPSGGRILTATPKKPFLKIIMRLDTSILLELLAEIPFPATERNDENSPRQGIAVVDTDPYLLDAFLRLTELLKPEDKPQVHSPSEQAVLAPLIIRELHYRLLQGPLGSRLRMIHTQGSKNYQIAQAILWLKNNYTKPLHINELAKLVSMAPSTFMRQFLQLTTISPLQYQKRLRLHEAQHLMLTERMDTAHAAYSVGYESINQFNREYKRLFGEPPKKNIKRLLAG